MTCGIPAPQPRTEPWRWTHCVLTSGWPGKSEDWFSLGQISCLKKGFFSLFLFKKVLHSQHIQYNISWIWLITSTKQNVKNKQNAPWSPKVTTQAACGAACVDWWNGGHTWKAGTRSQGPPLSSAPVTTDPRLLPEAARLCLNSWSRRHMERPGRAPPLEDASETATCLPWEGKRPLPPQTPRALLTVSCHVSAVFCSFLVHTQRLSKDRQRGSAQS